MYTQSQIQVKIENYCVYQERSQQEVRDKLYSWGLHKNEVENAISHLIENNFLNEERFAIAYTQGKLRIKKWGRFKIKQGLKMKRVSEPLIKTALKTIDPDEYYENLKSVLDKKASLLKVEDEWKRKNTLIQYGISRGYERDLIFEILNHNDL